MSDCSLIHPPPKNYSSHLAVQPSHDVTAEVTKIISHPLRNLGTIKSNYEERFEQRPFEHSRANEGLLARVITSPFGELISLCGGTHIAGTKRLRLSTGIVKDLIHEF